MVVSIYFLSCPPQTKGFPWGRKGSCLRRRLMSFDPTRPNSRLKANFFTVFCFLAVYSSGKTHSFLLSFSYLSFPLCPLPVLPSPLRALTLGFSYAACLFFSKKYVYKNFFSSRSPFIRPWQCSLSRVRARTYKYTVDTRFCGLFLFLSPLPSSAYSLFSSPSRAISPSQKNFFAKSNYRNVPFSPSLWAVKQQIMRKYAANCIYAKIAIKLAFRASRSLPARVRSALLQRRFPLPKMSVSKFVFVRSTSVLSLCAKLPKTPNSP